MTDTVLRLNRCLFVPTVNCKWKQNKQACEEFAVQITEEMLWTKCRFRLVESHLHTSCFRVVFPTNVSEFYIYGSVRR